jgi:hypothetical protein
MEKIASKQIDGIVDLNSFQNIPARKQFEGGVGAGYGPTGHYPLLSGGYIYWVLNPAAQPQEGDFRMGISPSTSLLTLQKLQSGNWVTACLDGCSSTTTSGGGTTDPGTGGGCLVYGTLILLPDGSSKKIEDLEMGDLVKTVAITGLDSEQEDAWKTFSTDTFTPSEESSVVMGIQKSQYGYYFLINHELKITFEHPVFALREGIYAFKRANNLVVGDRIFHYTLGLQEITSIERINETVNVVNINVESQDTYFAENYLVHNLIDVNQEKTIIQQ